MGCGRALKATMVEDIVFKKKTMVAKFGPCDCKVCEGCDQRFPPEELNNDGQCELCHEDKWRLD